MIESAAFTRYDGYSIALGDDQIPFNNITIDRDIRVDENERALEHGLWPTPAYLGKAVYTLAGDLMTTANTPEGYNANRMSLLRAFYPTEIDPPDCIGTLAIKFAGIAERLTAKCTLESWPELPLEALSPSAGKYQIALKSFDPRLYGEAVNTISSLAASQTVQGRVYAKTYPKVYPTTTTPGYSSILANAGNADVAPILTANGPGANPSFTVQYGALSKTLSLPSLALVAGDVLVIDVKAKTAILNGSVNVYNYLTGSFWKVPPGSSTFVYNASIGTTTLASYATLAWQNGYVY